MDQRNEVVTDGPVVNGAYVPPGPSWLWRVEIAIAFALVYPIFMLMADGGCAWAQCVDLNGIPIFLAGAVLALVVPLCYWRLRHRWRRYLWLRWTVDALAVVVIVAGLAAPRAAVLLVMPKHRPTSVSTRHAPPIHSERSKRDVPVYRDSSRPAIAE